MLVFNNVHRYRTKCIIDVYNAEFKQGYGGYDGYGGFGCACIKSTWALNYRVHETLYIYNFKCKGHALHNKVAPLPINYL